MSDTIAAIATPLADGAISIIRISGDCAIEIIQTLFDKDMMHRKANTITYGYIRHPKTQEVLDEVLVSLFRAPRSFTGEDVVEINCHGGSFITKEVLKYVLGAGARLARAGEFTQRSFLNGRIDLAQAESVMDLIEAKDKANAHMAIEGIRGSVKKLLEPLIRDILDIIANIEVNIDYPEYDDVEQLSESVLLPKIRDWISRIDAILEKSESGQIVKEGIKTAIVGKPNVGKSSLLNALLEEEKAIVTEIAGTTRDIVEGSIRLKGITLHLIDTAGIRETQDAVEKIGIARSKQAIAEAQFVLLVLDGSQPLDEADQAIMEMVKQKQHLLVYNKSDVYMPTHDGICISALNNDITQLTDALQDMYEHHAAMLQEPVLNNERQIGLMENARNAMIRAMDALTEGVQCDLAEIDIQEAYRYLKEILGEYHREDLLDTLFANFCLGK